MKTSESKSTLSTVRFEAISQMKIRSGLRGGANTEACEKTLEDWKRSHYKWYEVAKYKSV